MAFPSLPVYLDPPDWPQVLRAGGGADHGAGNVDGDVPAQQHVRPPATAPTASGGGGAGIRPSSMAEQARLAKVPPPQPALKCPRCDSTNTKFCYYNNYSLTQPRHFCKACRRYWTHGGTLRNVPVGGGCRRNKRLKSSSSSAASAKAAASTTITNQKAAAASSSAPAKNMNSSTASMITALPPHLPFFGSVQNFGDFGLADLGSGFPGLLPQLGFEFPPRTAGGFSSGSVTMEMEPWRMPPAPLAQQTHHQQQFPFFGDFRAPSPPPAPVLPAMFQAGLECNVVADDGTTGKMEALTCAAPPGLGLNRPYISGAAWGGASVNSGNITGSSGGIAGGGRWEPADMDAFNSNSIG